MAVASRFVLLNGEQVKEFSESFDNENKKEDLVRFEGFQRISRHFRREENKNGQFQIFCLRIIKRTLHVGSKI